MCPAFRPPHTRSQRRADAMSSHGGGHLLLLMRRLRGRWGQGDCGPGGRRSSDDFQTLQEQGASLHRRARPGLRGIKLVRRKSQQRRPTHRNSLVGVHSWRADRTRHGDTPALDASSGGLRDRQIGGAATRYRTHGRLADRGHAQGTRVPDLGAYPGDGIAPRGSDAAISPARACPASWSVASAHDRRSVTRAALSLLPEPKQILTVPALSRRDVHL
jgi:hypothetical protein